jgi:L-seryl-tRNA(Ser) seleniumtransferase
MINATGVLLHTNLGRAPVLPAAADAAREAAVSYTNLELDVDSGARGGRGAYVAGLLTSLTGAEAAHVVNNNAGMLFLTLLALAPAGSVPVSRGELIEIGGSYRLPDLMAATGARLVEVGTTNRTRASDYEVAIDDDTAMILKVHPSNYRITGFTAAAGLPELRPLAQRAGVPLVLDAGSGLIDARAPWLSGPPPAWLEGEPGVRQSLEEGADLVMFSGDKLLGGPQAGIAVGRSDLIDSIRSHPAARAMRIAGPELAALAVTLEQYATGTAGGIPLWGMSTIDPEVLRARSERVLAQAGTPGGIVEAASTIGAGSVPGAQVAGPVIVLDGPADELYLNLLRRPPEPVLARREAGRVWIDLRTVNPDDDGRVASALALAWRS